MDCSKLSKKEVTDRIIAMVHKGQAGGAYGVEEAKILDSALAYFDPNVSEDARPPLTNDQRDQKAVAYDVLKQAVHVAQRRGGAYSVKDAALIFDLLQRLEQVASEPDTKETKKKKDSKTALPKVEEVSDDAQEDEEEEEAEVPQPRQRRR